MKETITILPLGVNGWMPGEGRETACIAAALGDALVLLDCGTGARRLLDPRVKPLVDRAKRIYIFLSHYHLDHIIGIIFLPGLLAGKDVVIAGPGNELSGTTLESALEELTSFPFFSHDIDGFPMKLELVELGPGQHGFPHFAITSRRQEHTFFSTGFRIDDAIAYATDTVPDDGTIDLARGAGILIHECWLDSAGYEEARRTNALTGRGHTHASAAARIAAEAGAGMLGMMHFNPIYDDGRLASMESEARSIFPESFLMRDMQEIRIPR